MGAEREAVVLLCEGLAGRGLDVAALEAWLRAAMPRVEVRRARGPCCALPGPGVAALEGASGAVLGVCARDWDVRALETEMRRAGLDPFRVEVVRLGPSGAAPADLERAKLLSAGALARLRAAPGVGPASLKPVLAWGPALSRRALFTLPPVRYEPVPAIRAEACAVAAGCRVCASLCPHRALAVSAEGWMTVDATRCTSCGACVSSCPREAMDLPGAMSAQAVAQLGALLGTAGVGLAPRAVVFVCPRSARALEASAAERLLETRHWLPVEVPCLGTVTPDWILHALQAGAAAVATLPCPLEECRFGRRELLASRVEYCRAVLGAVGAPPDAVQLLEPGPRPALPALACAAAPAPPGEGPAAALGPRATAAAILALARRSGAPLQGAVTHPGSPLGVVGVARGCTLCGRCTEVCPTGALARRQEGGEVALTFEAAACVACGTCVPVCPERVVQVERRTDLARLAEGPRVLYRDTEVRCERCGEPIATRAVLDRLAAMLGDDPVAAAIRRLCLRCRGLPL